MIQHLKYPDKEPERGPEWHNLVIKDLRGDAVTVDRTGVGVKTRWHYKFYFFTFRWDDEVIEWSQYQKIAWKAISTWDMVDSFTIQPCNDATQLTYDMVYMPPYSVFGNIWYRLFVHKHIDRNIEYTLSQMKKSAEMIAKARTHTEYVTDAGSTLQSLERARAVHLIDRGVYVASNKYRDQAADDTIPYIRVGDMQDGTISQRNLVSENTRSTVTRPTNDK